jgi:hypothetical protein
MAINSQFFSLSFIFSSLFYTVFGHHGLTKLSLRATKMVGLKKYFKMGSLARPGCRNFNRAGQFISNCYGIK